MANHMANHVELDRTFAAYAHPIRRGIVERLADREMTVGEATSDFGVSKPAVSARCGRARSRSSTSTSPSSVRNARRTLDEPERGRVAHASATSVGSSSALSACDYPCTTTSEVRMRPSRPCTITSTPPGVSRA